MTTTHPDARCGRCRNCLHVNLTKPLIMADCAPAGPGLDQSHINLWHETLIQNPCVNPLVLVTYDKTTCEGRILDRSENPSQLVTVSTAKLGVVTVPETAISDWSPSYCLDGINFEHLTAALASMPITWYPQLLRTIVKAGHTKKVWQPFGASWSVISNEGKLEQEAGKFDASAIGDAIVTFMEAIAEHHRVREPSHQGATVETNP